MHMSKQQMKIARAAIWGLGAIVADIIYNRVQNLDILELVLVGIITATLAYFFLVGDSEPETT